MMSWNNESQARIASPGGPVLLGEHTGMDSLWTFAPTAGLRGAKGDTEWKEHALGLSGWQPGSRTRVSHLLVQCSCCFIFYDIAMVDWVKSDKLPSSPSPKAPANKVP